MIAAYSYIDCAVISRSTVCADSVPDGGHGEDKGSDLIAEFILHTIAERIISQMCVIQYIII